MDKTNRNTRNTSANTANTQQQTTNRTASRANQPTAATAPSASATLAQQAPSLAYRELEQQEGSKKAQVQKLKQEVQELKQEAQELKQEAQKLESEMTLMKQEVQELKSEMTLIKRLNVSCAILSKLTHEFLESKDESVLRRIIEMLSKCDPRTKKTLIDEFIEYKHPYGMTIAQTICSLFSDPITGCQKESLEETNARQKILNELNFKIGNKSLFALSYRLGLKTEIEAAENILLKLLSPDVCLKGSKTSTGVFQLARVINQQSVAQMQDYIFKYSNRLEAGAWNETSPEQFALYFVYGFLGKNSDVLGSLLSRLEACADTEFKGQTEQKISGFFVFFLNDLREAYIKDCAIQPNDYDDVILYVCKALPQFVDEKIGGLLMHAASHPSVELLKRLIAIENPKKQCFLDLIYADVQCPDGRVSGYILSFITRIEDFLLQDAVHCAAVSPVFLNLDLPHLVQYLSKVSVETIAGYNRNAERKQFQYLILSILTKDINCIERFRHTPITSAEQAQFLSTSLIQLMKHLFGMDASGQSVRKPIQPIILEHSFGMDVTDSLSEEVLLEDRELFFKILDALKGLSVLNHLDLTTNILNLCLKKDFELDMAGSATPNFDYMLQGLQKIGFDLHYIDPNTGLNILAEAYSLERALSYFPLFRKLLSLGCNPFVIQNDGMSVYSRAFSGGYNEKKFCAIILLDLNLSEHPFLSPDFTKNVLKNNRLDQRDEQKRTPLMLYVMMNIDIRSYFGKNLQKLDAKHLEAKDDKGCTVFDYARHNEDQKTLDRLNERKEALEKKANKPSIFRQAAQAVVLVPKLATPKAPNVEVSETPASSASNQKTQARKLRDKAEVNSAQETTINYNAETGTSTTSTNQVDTKAAEVPEQKKEEAAAGQNKNQDTDKKKSFGAGLKQRGQKVVKIIQAGVEVVQTGVEVVQVGVEIAKTGLETLHDPQGFFRKFPRNLSQSKTGERLASGQKVYNIGKAKPVAMLGDSSLSRPFMGLSELAHRLNQTAAIPIEAKHIKVLEELDTIRWNKRAPKVKVKPSFITRLQNALHAIMGMGGKRVKGSHQNIAWEKNANEEGGGITMVTHGNKMDIQNLKNIHSKIEYKLKCLLNEGELSQLALSSPDSREIDERNLHDSVETSQGKNETPEPSESEESNS